MQDLAESSEQQPSRFYIYMIDVVYGLIIANSFLNIGKIVFPPNKIFNLEGVTLAFGAFFVYYFVLSGWYGLHQSIQRKPFDPKNSWSKVRFALNLFIIFLEFYLFSLATGGGKRR